MSVPIFRRVGFQVAEEFFEFRLVGVVVFPVGEAGDVVFADFALEGGTQICIQLDMTSAELKRWLEQRGCTFEKTRSGHLKVRRGQHASVLPMHGKSKELGTGLVNAIKKQLGLK